ncbi:MAG: inorganic diphosphatase, partial [Planctomycetota bacterium]
VIGTIRLIDGGELDDKILAVPVEGALAGVRSVAQLDAEFSGATTILSTFFENYKGRGKLQCSGFGSAEEAEQLVDRCSASFERFAAVR